MTQEHPEQPKTELVKELRELVEEWRYEYELPAGSAGYLEVAKSFEKCGNELQEVIDRYE